MKKLVSLLLAGVLLVSYQGSALAASALYDQPVQSSHQLRDTHMLLHAKNRLEYTYFDHGKQYKNVDMISDDQKSVFTEKYEYVQHEWRWVDRLSYQIQSSEGNISIAFSSLSNAFDDGSIDMVLTGESWRYRKSYRGDNSFEVMTIGAIAAGLAAAIANISGLPWTAAFLIGAAANIFERNLHTIYYTVTEYVDDTNRLRPKYKEVINFYSDSAHNTYMRTETRIFDAVM